MKYCPMCGKEYEDGEVCEKDGALLVRQQEKAESLVGLVLKDSYRIVEQIGEGGMASVFRGVQMPLERDVAVKVMLPSLQSTPSMIQRFFQEAKLLCRLSHPNVVSIFDFGNTESGMVYMVMEFLRGRPLRAKVPSTGLPLDETVRLMEEICAGVGAVHSCGLAHRDLKPDNIFVVQSSDGTEQIKIIDFGIARDTDDELHGTRLTQTGLVMGTPGFLAPEQIGDAGDADARADIYALGAVLYWMLTGRRPYAGNTPNAILTKQLREPPPLDVGCLKDHRALARVVEKAMHRKPDERYQTPGDLARALRAVADDTDQEADDTLITGSGVAPETVITQPLRRPPAKKNLRPFGIAAAALLLTLGLAFFLVERLPDRPRAASEDDGEAALPSARGVFDERIVVGMSAAFSGSSKELGRGMRLGIETCFQEINDDGGIHGRRLHLVALDDGYEPSRTVANMAELLLERKVFAVLGNVGTPTAEVAVPLAREQDAPFFGAFTGADLLRSDPPEPLIFNYRAGYAQETAALVEYFLDVRGLRPEEIAVFAQEDSFGDAGYRGVVDTLARRGHEAKVPRIGYRRNRTEVDDAVDRLLRLDPKVEAVILVATYRASAELIQQLREKRPEMIFAGLSFIGSRALAEELAEMGPRFAEGVIVTQVVPHYESSQPGVERYRDALSTYFPSEQPGFVSLEGYLACRTFAAGVDKAGPALTSDALVAAMESLSALDLGLGSTVRFGPRRHQGSDEVWGTVLDRSATYQMLDLKP